MIDYAQLAAEERHYILLAEDARQDARRITDPFSKRVILQIAQSYENLAQRAAERAAVPDGALAKSA